MLKLMGAIETAKQDYGMIFYQRSFFSHRGIADELPMYCRYFADKL